MRTVRRQWVWFTHSRDREKLSNLLEQIRYKSSLVFKSFSHLLKNLLQENWLSVFLLDHSLMYLFGGCMTQGKNYKNS